MPIYNSRGDVLAGIGTAPISINSQVIGTGGRGGWVDANTVVYNRAMTTVMNAARDELAVFDSVPGPSPSDAVRGPQRLRDYLDDHPEARTVPELQDLDPELMVEEKSGWNVVTHSVGGTPKTVLAGGANTTDGGGGVWAAWVGAPGGGLYISTGQHLPDAGVPSVGPDGAVAYSPNYQAGVGVDVREVSGQVWRLTNGIAYDIQLLGQGKAIWREGFRVTTHGLPTIDPPITDAYRPRAVNVNGEWWVVYYSGSLGMVARPFTSILGYAIGFGDKFAHDAVVKNGNLWLVWAYREGEFPNDLDQMPLDLTKPRILLVVQPPKPPDPKPPEPGPEPTQARTAQAGQPPKPPSLPTTLVAPVLQRKHYVCAETDGTLIANRMAPARGRRSRSCPANNPAPTA